MAFLRKNALERAMQRAARDPDEYQDDFFAALLQSKLLLPEPDLREGEDGRPYHAVFSSASVLRASFPGSAHREVDARQAFEQFALSAADVVLNPGGDPYYVFDPTEVRALAEGLMPGEAHLAPRDLPAGHRLALALPDPNPVGLKSALLGAFEDLPTVKAAYLLEMADRDRRRLFLGIELTLADEDEMARVIEALDPVLQENLKEGQFLDAAMLNESSLLAACREVAPPFFSR